MRRFAVTMFVPLAICFAAGHARADPTSSRIGVARDRIFSPNKSCSAVQAAVAQGGSVIVAQSDFVYERVFSDSGACRNEVTSAPAFTPTLDQPSCFAGYRCKQRNNGDGGQR